MRLVPIAVVLAACGGGASVSTEPTVAITTRLCNVNSLGLLVVNVDYLVSADPGRGFTASVDVLDTPNPGQENSSFFCGGWTPTEVGGRNVGCQRDDLGQDEAVTIEHLYNTEPDPLPGAPRVALLGSVVQEPGGDFMIANAQETLNCTVEMPQ